MGSCRGVRTLSYLITAHGLCILAAHCSSQDRLPSDVGTKEASSVDTERKDVKRRCLVSPVQPHTIEKSTSDARPTKWVM